MADAIVYATAIRHGATPLTGDADFDGLPGTIVVR
jgi:predicted nucleic acid-binding protein